MKISRIETYPVALELLNPFRIANASFAAMYYVVIKVSTDAGVSGYGESIPAWEVTGETQFSVMDCIHHLTEAEKLGFSLLGSSVASLEDVREIMSILCPQDRVSLFSGAPSAKAGLEQALLDIVGKVQEKPSYELFGGERRPVPFAHVLGIEPVAETLARAGALLERGVSRIKVKIGVEGVGGLAKHRRDVEVVQGIKELIERLRPSATLVADANQGFVTASSTVAFLKQVPGCLDYLEQPVLAGDYFGMREIKEHCDVALMADESLHSCRDAQILLELQAVDVFNVKLMKCGGVIEALKLAALAKQHKKRVVLGSMLESQIGAIPSLHTFFCDPAFETVEAGFFSCLKSSIGRGLDVADDRILVPSGAGNGLDVDERDIRKHLLTPRHSTTLRQVLGLYQGSAAAH